MYTFIRRGVSSRESHAGPMPLSNSPRYPTFCILSSLFTKIRSHSKIFLYSTWLLKTIFCSTILLLLNMNRGCPPIQENL
jgi:hypothetical protein